METRYTCHTPGGQIRIVHSEENGWQVYAEQEYLGSFPTADAAVTALAEGSCKWPAGLNADLWIGPASLQLWSVSRW